MTENSNTIAPFILITRLFAPLASAASPAGGNTITSKDESALAGKLTALDYAAKMLLEARKLQDFQNGEIKQAFALLKHSNPKLVNWALYEIGDLVEHGNER